MHVPTQVSKIKMPKRDMEQNRQQRPDVRFLKQPPSCRRDPQVALVPSQERGGLSNMTNKEEGQKVRFVDDLVELKSISFVESGPCESIAHFRYDAARQVPRRSEEHTSELQSLMH